jgi:N-acetylmuramic acid 6-phosphate etherase
MRAARTELLHHRAEGLDALPPHEIAAVLHEAQTAAAKAVGAALPALVGAAGAMAQSLRSGGRLIYVAAGSSGLMAAADALELRGTFGIPTDRIVIRMAGGMPAGSEMPGGVEDDRFQGRAAGLEAAAGDCVIAVAASGATPFTVAAAEAARGRAAAVIGIANNPDGPLLVAASHPVCLPTPPEPLAGSTRMGAGTAQKIALNILSTLMAVELGHVHDGMMVNLIADNEKLRSRAAGIVASIARCPPDTATGALDAAGGSVKFAVLIAAGAGSRERAQALLDENDGRLRAALARL